MQGKAEREIPAVIKLFFCLAAAGIAGWIALVIFVTVREKSIQAPGADETEAIIVLGAQVKDNGELSVQLKWRLDKALEVYNLNPQPVVVCGAQGNNEPEAEAAAMKKYMMENGIPENAIMTDDSSFNTRQNLTNAKVLLPADVGKVLIVTSDYHLPRALAIAADMGLDAAGIGSPIKLVYWPKNHFREALAWVKYWMQKYGVLPL